MLEFDGILLNPCLLQSSFHVAGISEGVIRGAKEIASTPCRGEVLHFMCKYRCYIVAAICNNKRARMRGYPCLLQPCFHVAGEGDFGGKVPSALTRRWPSPIYVHYH